MYLVHLGCQMQFSLLLIAAVPCCLSGHVTEEVTGLEVSTGVVQLFIMNSLLIKACHFRVPLLKIGTVIPKSSTDWWGRTHNYITLRAMPRLNSLYGTSFPLVGLGQTLQRCSQALSACITGGHPSTRPGQIDLQSPALSDTWFEFSHCMKNCILLSA